MKFKFRPKGPRLRTKLLLMGLVLLVIPYMGLQSMRAMKDFLFESQAQAQLMTARGIATVLYNQPGLFNDLPASLEGYAELPLYPLEEAIQLDAFADDWGDGILRKSQSFSGSGVFFNLILGEYQDQLYGFLEVNDSTQVNRNPDVLRLNHADHVRLYFKDVLGIEQRIQINFEGSGRTTAYYMDEDWTLATNEGRPESKVQGYVQRRSDSYLLEFRIPLELMGNNKQLGIAVADAHNVEDQKINAMTGTFPTLDGSPYNLMVLRSPKLEDILEGIAITKARIWILDNDRRVRAISGQLSGSLTPEDEDEKPFGIKQWHQLLSWINGLIIGIPKGQIVDFDPNLTYTRDDRVLQTALSGTPAERRRRSLDKKTHIITVAQPIYNNNTVVGAVLLERSTNDILTIQSESFERLANLTLISLLAVIITIVLFSARLTLRIRRLGQETSASIDDYGRLQGLSIHRDLRSGDEIGDLARNINLALNKLNQHQGFLANIPRTLRHEINNPLNTISTSLDNLGHETGDPNNPYLESARRGLRRIGDIVGKLADAANLEEALDAEERFDFDLADMLRSYCKNQELLYSDFPITFLCDEPEIILHGSDMHIEQLLDKLLDNARDFCTPNTAISVTLIRSTNSCSIEVSNQGPLLDADEMPNLFQMMHSKRTRKSPGHFGLGLYIARVISQHHGGKIRAENLTDSSGPCFTVTLPIVD